MTKSQLKKPHPPGDFVRKNMGVITKPSRQRGDKAAVPSHQQMAKLCSMLFDNLSEAETCVVKMSSLVKEEQETLQVLNKSSNVMTEHSKSLVGKTPISWLETVLSVCASRYKVEQVPCMDLIHCGCTGYFVECVLSRRPSKTKLRTSTESNLSESIPLIEYSGEDSSDSMWKTVLLVLPHSATFYPARNFSRGGIQALPISWLRLRRSSGIPAKGGYAKSIEKIYQIVSTLSFPRLTLPCYQMNDEEDGVPLLPPDSFSGELVSHPSKAKQMYREQMPLSKSFRYGCRRYVKSALHQNLNDEVLILDQHEMGNVQLAVTVRDKNGRVHDISYIQVCNALDEPSLLLLLEKGGNRLKSRPGNCRLHTGDKGRMYAVGEIKRAGVTGLVRTKVTDLLAADDLLKEICAQSSQFARKAFMSVLSAIKQIENQAGRSPDNTMGGANGPACSMNISSNLGNATHFDVSDASVGYSVWTELVPGSATNWYFVLPNIVIKHEGRSYNGVAIKLFHGVAIAWDGRIIRHGTSITNAGSTDNRCFGWFWSACQSGAEVSLSEVS